MALGAVSCLALPDITKPFHLYVDKARGIAKGVLMSLAALNPVSFLPDDNPTQSLHDSLEVTYLTQSTKFDITDILLAIVDEEYCSQMGEVLFKIETVVVT